MIDWFRGSIEMPHHALKTGHVLSISPDCSVTWHPDNTFEYHGTPEWVAVKRFEARGSFESSLFLRSAYVSQDGIASELRIDGNLSKFLQGHNLFGLMPHPSTMKTPCVLSGRASTK